jgi:hypothetical protein
LVKSPLHRSRTRNFIHISMYRTQQQPKSYLTHITNSQVALGIPPNQFHELQLSMTFIHMLGIYYLRHTHAHHSFNFLQLHNIKT